MDGILKKKKKEQKKIHHKDTALKKRYVLFKHHTKKCWKIILQIYLLSKCNVILNLCNISKLYDYWLVYTGQVRLR